MYEKNKEKTIEQADLLQQRQTLAFLGEGNSYLPGHTIECRKTYA